MDPGPVICSHTFPALAISDKHSSQLLAILVTHLREPKLLKLTVETESGRLIILDSTFRSCLCSIRRLTGAHIYLSVWSGSQGLWSDTLSHTCLSTLTPCRCLPYTWPHRARNSLCNRRGSLDTGDEGKLSAESFNIALGISLNVVEVMVYCGLCNGFLISGILVQNMTCRNFFIA